MFSELRGLEGTLISAPQSRGSCEVGQGCSGFCPLKIPVDPGQAAEELHL